MISVALGTVALALLTLQTAASQAPLQVPSSESADYTFKWPIRKVAVIGAGVSGMISYREFLKAGFDVHVFERDHLPGGNWYYTDEVPDKAPIPNAECTIGDYIPSLPPKGVKFPYEQIYHGHEAKEVARSHRAPKPVWKSMTAGPAPDIQIDDFPWPAGTPWELSNAQISGYLRAFASYNGANSNDNNPRLSYNTRVELVEKHFDEEGKEAGWTLTLKTVTRTDVNSSKAVWTKQEFDAIVVATGRFNAPNIPNIPGLVEWDKAFPNRVMHSRQYRHPESFTNQTVLVVGAASSGDQISRELDTHAKKIFTSIRADNSTVAHGTLKFLLRPLPPSIEVVGEVKRFLPPTSTIGTSSIELANGTSLTGVDAIIFATGFRYSFPFLPQYHNPSVPNDQTGPSNLPQPIVTDGTHLRNLYLDIFYIEEPTIGFVNMNIGPQPFAYSEYVAVALSKVWSNKAKIPSVSELWQWNTKQREERQGFGRHYLYMGVDQTDKMYRYFTAWLNDAAAKYGGRQVNGQGPVRDQTLRMWLRARYGDSNVAISSLPNTCMNSFDEGAMTMQCGESKVDIRDLAFSEA
ncbi:FAD/NAD(P)-binding domain-containing protein [Crepidotus variabilis]|uniref:FAD/NAD(P)-binding domain-containing protein n=1 Tax=Crepidotus variabilis TaxID=179855 RepID=A0A9P6JMG8_9AGAR|nr:FAD/NAD(P)-binding domain-containing protein [Crepidotus variabilis]